MQISNARDSFLERMFDQQLEKTGGEKPEKLKPFFVVVSFLPRRNEVHEQLPKRIKFD